MSKDNSIFRRFLINSFYSFLSEISIILLFVLFIVAARVLGSEKFGVFSFALAYVGIFGILNDFGLRYVYLRDVARDNTLANKYFANILTLQIAASLLSIFLAITFILVTDRTDEQKIVVCILGAAETLRIIKLLLRFVFRAANQFHIEVITVVLERCLLLICGVSVLLLGYSVVWFVSAFVFVRVIDLIFTGYFSNKTAEIRIGTDTKLWLPLIKQSIPFGLVGIAMLLMLKIDSVMLSYFRNDSEVGWYNAAYKLIEGAMILPVIIVNSLIPQISKLHNDKASISFLLEKGVRYITVIGIPLVVIGYIVSSELIEIIYGNHYLQATSTFQILLMSMIFSFLYTTLGAIPAATNKQIVTFYVALASLIINVIANLIAIPKYGGPGAAYATFLSSFVFFALLLVHIKREKYILSLTHITMKPLVSAILTGIFVYNYTTSIFITIPASIALYLLMLTALSYWNEGEKYFLKSLIRKLTKKIH